MKKTFVFFLILTTALLAGSIHAAHHNALLAGYAEVDITPPMGVGMPGYFTERKADGVLDPLLIKSLALTRDDATVLILAVDLITLNRPVIDKMRGAITTATKVPAERIFIHATHTHTGARVSEIEDKLPEQAAAAVLNALKNQKPEANVACGSAQESSVTFIRRYLMTDGSVRTNPGRANPNIVRPIGQIDPNVNVLSFHDAKISIVSHGLHCDCVSGTKFSADYPYHLTQRIKEGLGADWNVIFLNACCGNLNHINVHDKSQKSGNEEARKIGRALGEAALKAHAGAAQIQIDKIDSRVTTINTPIRKVPEELYAWAKAEMQQDSEKAKKRNFNEYTPKGVIQLAETTETNRPAEIIALRIGPVGIVGLPAECFVEMSRYIQNHSLLDSTFVIGLTGGSRGYVPHQRGYSEGGYEATYSSAPLAPVTPNLWTDAAISLLKELKTAQ